MAYFADLLTWANGSWPICRSSNNGRSSIWRCNQNEIIRAGTHTCSQSADETDKFHVGNADFMAGCHFNGKCTPMINCFFFFCEIKVSGNWREDTKRRRDENIELEDTIIVKATPQTVKTFSLGLNQDFFLLSFSPLFWSDSKTNRRPFHFSSLSAVWRGNENQARKKRDFFHSLKQAKTS